MEDVSGSISRTNMTWDQFIGSLGLEDDVIGQFFEDSADLADEWASLVSEDMERVTESVVGGFPVWDQYEQEAKVSLANVIAAQDRFLEDMRAWVDLQPTIMETASSATQTWLNSLDPILRGGIARAWSENTGQMEIGRAHV